MRLDQWLQHHNVSAKEFADRVGVNKATAYRWLDGKSMPQAEHLAVIMRMTGNAVTANDFMAAVLGNEHQVADDVTQDVEVAAPLPLAG